ncbi:MAG: hypothetical protein R3A52_24340 [Polyangiales bacterium]
MKASAPSGQPDATLVVWVEDDGEPSVGFGGWHARSVAGGRPRRRVAV